jgi:hypothetical protein
MMLVIKKILVLTGMTLQIVEKPLTLVMKIMVLKHPTPYKVSWLQKGHQVTVTKQCLVEFEIGG